MNDEVISALVNGFGLIVPEMVLGLAACVLFVGGTFRANRHVWAALALAALVAAALALWRVPVPPQSASAAVYAGPVYLDPLGWLIKGIALAAGVVLVLFSWNEVPDRQAAEYHACLLVIIAGLCLTGVANDLVVLFLALELISIPTYVLLYLPRHDTLSQEAALKYFLLSVFSSALLLFGFSYLYGLAGTTNLSALVEALGKASGPGPVVLPAVALIALVMVVAGLSFRITAVPFHFYAPDVYQGAPTAAVALLAFVPKAAGFVALLRVLGFVWSGHSGPGLALGGQTPILLWLVAAVTMSLGNVLALLQHNIKRLLAYSSVAHAGYMLIGLAAAYQLSRPGAADWFPGGVAAVLFYLVAYGAMTVGAFAILAYLSTPERPVETEDDLAGLSSSHPGVALLMVLFLFSLIGIPGTAGFAGKFLLFYGAMAADSGSSFLFRWLALIGVLNSAVGAWYYLRIVARMYLHTPVQPLPNRRGVPALLAIWLCAAVTVWAGVYPEQLKQQASNAAPAPRDQVTAARAEKPD